MEEEKRRVDDLTDDDYRAWRHHPITKLLRKYLGDYQAVLRNLHTMRWEAGRPDDFFEAEARGQLKAIGEIQTLEFDHIADFYEPPREESEDMDATQATETNAG